MDERAAHIPSYFDERSRNKDFGVISFLKVCVTIVDLFLEELNLQRARHIGRHARLESLVASGRLRLPDGVVARLDDLVNTVIDLLWCLYKFARRRPTRAVYGTEELPGLRRRR